MSASKSSVEKIEAELSGPVAALGLDLEAVEITPAGKRRVLRIAVDRDAGIGMDDVAEATRAINEILDASTVMGQQPYTLEVTSRGVDRPLTLPRHWRRNHDRLVKVTLADGSKVEGRIGASDEDGVELELAGKVRRLGYDQVGRAVVQIEFNRKTADVDSVDEEEN